MIERLRLLNPLQPGDESLVDPARREADLARILTMRTELGATDRRGDALFTRRVALGGLAAAGAASLLVVGAPLLPGSGPSSAHAATPPVLDGSLAAGWQATTTLTSAAQSAQTSTVAGRLGSQFTTWSLFTRMANGEPVRSAVVPQDVTLTLAADGSGHLTVRIGAAQFPAGGDTNGLNLPPEGSITRDDRFGPGETPRIYPEPLSVDPPALWGQLTRAHPITELGTGELFVAIADLYKEQRPAPEVRAQLLHLLAQRTDVLELGVLQDRAGRSGIGIGTSNSQPGGLPARFVLIFDLESGALLGYEQILTSTPGKLEVKIPAVIDYALFR